jgi:uncharacterized protein with von Willebrand factor type A (vWA) domain
VLLRGIDRAAFVVAFAARLRRAGVAVGLTGIEAFARGLQACPPDSYSALYWTARITLVCHRAELEIFDAVFAAVFADAAVELDPHARRRLLAPASGDELSPAAGPAAAEQEGGGLPWASLPARTGEASDNDDPALGVHERLASSLESVAETPFEDLDPEHLALLADWLTTALAAWPRRLTRRLAGHPAGRRVAMRPTLARARRTGWEPVELVRDRPLEKRRRVVMLCDVSQSMQPYATAYLHLMRAVAIATDAEVFAFATSLTRLTPVLAHRSPSVAIDQATAKVADRFGGTRIASNLRALLASHHGAATRGAVVIVASDGWDSDQPDDLAAVMQRLRRRAYRIIWMNPRAASPGYAPLVGAMAAALPYCDALLPANNIAALAEVVAAIVGSASPRSSTAPRVGRVSSRASRGPTAGSGRC